MQQQTTNKKAECKEKFAYLSQYEILKWKLTLDSSYQTFCELYKEVIKI